MSITGSLVGYENNDFNNVKKNRSLLNMSTGSASKQCQSLNSSINNSVITAASGSVCNANNSKHQNNNNEYKQHNKRKRRLHLNSLWSIWYGISATIFQGYLVLHGAYRFLGCSLIQWRSNEPFTELNIQLILCGLVLLLLPLFFISALFKVGNLANDGIKLVTGNGRCSAKPDDGLDAEAKGGTLRALWTHGGPTSAFIHIITALSLLFPRLLLEARLIENGNLQREHIWRTELDFMVSHKDRLVTLSFMTTSPYHNVSNIDQSSFYDDSNFNENIYEKTHLIESFHSDNSDDLFNTHEEIELPPSIFATEKLVTTSKNSGTAKTTFRSVENSTGKNLEIDDNRNDGDGSEDDDDDADDEDEDDDRIEWTGSGVVRVKTKHGNVENNKKQERMKTSGNQYSNNGSRSGNGKKKSGKLNEQRKSYKETSTITENEHSKAPITTAGKIVSSEGRKEKLNKKNLGANEKLELKPSNKLNFNKINDEEVSTVLFEVNNENGKMTLNNRMKTASIDPLDSTSDPINTKKNIKESHIHIVKSAKPNEGLTVPSTPISTDSKIIEIKPTNKNGMKKFKRFSGSFQSENYDGITPSSKILIEPASLVGAIPAMNLTIKPVFLLGVSGYLQSILGVNKEIDLTNWSRPPSLEFINLIFAIIIWSVRYPAVFWGTSKSFATVFSLQMIANGSDILLGYVGVSVLYKLLIVNYQLPLQSPPLLLNAVVTISLFLLSTILILASSLIIYLYGHSRLSARIRDRRIISTKSSDTWAYFTHCASLCFVLALAVVKASIMHDLSSTYRGSLDGAVLAAVLGSIVHLFLWIFLWLGLTVKKRWHFKLIQLEMQGQSLSTQPLLVSPRDFARPAIGQHHHYQKSVGSGGGGGGAEDVIYWPKLTPSSPKLKVTFNEIPSTSSDHDLVTEHDGKRCPGRRASLCLSSPQAGEADDGDYATLRGPTGDLLHLSDLGAHCTADLNADDTSEEGKLLACVRDDSVTYASTKDLEPPATTNSPPESYIGSPEQLISPLAPVTVTVHTNEAHITSSLTPRCLRRADSGVPTDALLTPRSDTTSTESSISPPDRALSETSSGVHSGEEREDVAVIRPRPTKAIVKPPQPAIQEEPFGRSTNMKMSSFNKEGKSSSTLPLTRGSSFEQKHDNNNHHSSTMTLPIDYHQQQYRSQHFMPAAAPIQQFGSLMLQQQPYINKTQILQHTTLPNGLRYTNHNFLRRIPHVKNAESPYGILGLGAGHHTFSKLLHDPLLSHSIVNSTIPENRDSANYSMISDQDREICPGRRASLCLSSPQAGEADDGDYATLRGPTGDLLHLSDLGAHCTADLNADDTSEEGKLLACVRDDSVTYASTKDLEPPATTNSPPESYIGSPEQLISPLAPVTVTVHTNEAHITSSLTPRCLRRADSGVPTDALLTPRSDTTSTESSISPPDRALSETSSGVHSGEEREDVAVIRPRPTKAIVKPPQPAIQEEPFGRSTNMKMSSFNKEGKSSSTLPLTRGSSFEQKHDNNNHHSSTMTLPIDYHQQQYRSQHFMPAAAPIQQFGSLMLQQQPYINKTQILQHTTLPNGLRYTNHNFLRRIPHVKNAESPYGILGLGAGHHTFSKLLHDPLLSHSIVNSTIPENRDSANYSMISDQDREMYVNTTGNIN